VSPGTALPHNTAVSDIHRPGSDDSWWTTGNVGEAVPGVLTPLTYTFWATPFERTVRGSYSEMGVLSRADGRTVTDNPDDIALGIVFGRAVLNVRLILSVGAGLPGTSAAEVGANVLGDTAANITALPPNTPLRYPVVAVRLPLLAARLRRRMTRLEDEITRVWQGAGAADAAQATRLLPTIRELFTAALTAHSHATFLSSAIYEPLAGLVGDRTSLLTDLLSGYGGMVEVAMLQQLWEVAHERRTMADWLARYGYLAPYAGNLRSHSWREDPSPIYRLLGTYRAVAESDAPAGVERVRVAARRRAESELLAGVSPLKQPATRILLRLAAHFIPLREVGKNSYLRAVDAARACVRTVGADLATRGMLADPEDVWFLTWPELLSAYPDDAAAVIEQRRAQHATFETLTIPAPFHGCPDPLPLAAPEAGGTDHEELVLHGVAACGGIVEGRARVIADPTVDDDGLEPGEILVAAATDPSWTTLFVGAAAVVTDLGGTLSHGAIVARELGLPCVTNVKTGTAAIRTGDLIRVDGSRGTVEILARSDNASKERSVHEC
jgi:phosphohistidine swiveling domain-containing protein